MKMAHLAVNSKQQMKEDKVILDPAKQAEEVRKKNEEAKAKI